VSKTKKVQPRFQEYSLGFVGSLPYFMTVYHSPSPTPPLYSAIFFACEACPYVRERRVCIVDFQFFLKCEASTQISLLLFRVFRRPTLIVDRVFRPPSSRFVSDLSLFGFVFLTTEFAAFSILYCPVSNSGISKYAVFCQTRQIPYSCLTRYNTCR